MEEKLAARNKILRIGLKGIVCTAFLELDIKNWNKLMKIQGEDSFLVFIEKLIQRSCVSVGWIVSDYNKCWNDLENWVFKFNKFLRYQWYHTSGIIPLLSIYRQTVSKNSLRGWVSLFGTFQSRLRSNLGQL